VAYRSLLYKADRVTSHNDATPQISPSDKLLEEWPEHKKKPTVPIRRRSVAQGGHKRSAIMISQKAKYALRSLIVLARAAPGEAVQMPAIAAQERIPKKFLEQILLDLKRHGVVVSRRGKYGGYLLGRPANDISFGEVLRIVDGPLAPLACLRKVGYRRCEDCRDEGSCEVRRVFHDVTVASRSILDNTTLSDCVAMRKDGPASLQH
jgi:Rrf2 family protein